MSKADKEIEQFRGLMEIPSRFEDGFSVSSFVGALFVALVMIPGAIYMNLIAGMGVGQAAQWVTVILFIEIAKRANQKLSRAQIFILFYMAGSIVGETAQETILFAQFLIQSDAAASFGVASELPKWFAPSDPDVLAVRSFFQVAWLPALGLFIFRKFFSEIDSAVLGYGLFRLTSDIEKLPFPMAPIGAQGILALSDDLEGKGNEPWRWRVFSIGGAIGLIFGFIYMGLPALTGTFFDASISMLPIPFVDWTSYTEEFLPGVATGLSFDLGQLIIGMVMPFFAIVGSFIGIIVSYILNPILHQSNQLPSWTPGQNTVETLFNTNIDFYFSFGIGLSMAVALIGIVSAVRKGRDKDSSQLVKKEPKIHESRGDISTKWIAITYLFCVAAYIGMSGYLIEWNPGVMAVMFFYAFLYTPLMSYVTARLEGLAGQVVEIPFIREITFILSGYKGVAIWFLPIPKKNYGIKTVFYKQAELTGTSFRSVWKTDVILFPVIILSVVAFSSYIWSLAEIPSYIYPYTQEMWEFEAKNACLVYSSTLEGYSPFYEALDGAKVAIGFGAGMTLFGFMSIVGAPVLMVYGIVRGLGNSLPHTIIPNFIGALLGKYYFEKKLGIKWRQYVPVMSAGFFCGSGLIAMFCIGLVFLIKAASDLPY